MIAKLAALLVTSTVLAAGAFRHAGFKSSMPSPNSTVATPAKISVTFTEGIKAPPISSFSLLKADSTEAAKLTVSMVGDTTLTAKVPSALPAGKYIVRWKNGAADDGHPSRGAFAFTVK